MTIGFKVSPLMDAQIKAAARESGVSKSEYIRAATQAALDAKAKADTEKRFAKIGADFAGMAEEFKRVWAAIGELQNR